VPPKKTLTMTSSTDNVTVTSLQDTDDCHGQHQNNQGHYLSHGQSQSQDDRGQPESVVKTKPEKPVKPKNLLSLTKSRDTNGNCVTAVQSGSSSRSSRSSDAVDVLCASDLSSHVIHSFEQKRDGVDTAYGQNSLFSSSEQPTLCTTTTSTESAKQSSSTSPTSPQPYVCVETTARQISLRSNSEHAAHGTTTSPQTSLSISFAEFSYGNPEADGETGRRQGSARSEDKQRIKWTRESTKPSFSDDDLLSQLSYVEVESTCRQTNLRSDDSQLTSWTAESTEQIHRSSSDSLSSEHLADNDEITCRQDSPRGPDHQPAQWTTSSTPSASQSPHTSDLLHRPSDTTSGQTSLSCNDELQTTWIEASCEDISADDDDDDDDDDQIEPPIINNLLPANVHIRRGETLQLVAQFTAYPPPDICWFRSNDLLAHDLLEPGQTTQRYSRLLTTVFGRPLGTMCRLSLSFCNACIVAKPYVVGGRRWYRLIGR